MKKLLTFISSLILSINVFAQAPQKMTYQGVVRNGANNLVTSTTVGMRISILQTSTVGTAVYVETQAPSTNANGLVTTEIGTGTVVSGNFSTINWGAGPYFIKTETDPTGGTSYSITGTSQFNSVPYALYSANAINYTAGSGISINSGTISNTAPNQTVNITGTSGTTVTGTYPSYTISSMRLVGGTSTGGFAPTIINGSGFTAVRIGGGTYNVTFTTAFTSAPSVVVSGYVTNGPQIWLDEMVKVSNVTTTGFTVYTATGAGSPMGSSDGIPFSFVAVGN